MCYLKQPLGDHLGKVFEHLIIYSNMQILKMYEISKRKNPPPPNVYMLQICRNFTE